MTMTPVLAFAWENLGPTHIDRLTALAEAVGDRARVVALEFSARSRSYGWERTSATPFQVVTLFAEGERRTQAKLAARLTRAARRLGAGHVFLCHYQEPGVLAAAVALRVLGRYVHVLIDSKFDDYVRSLRVEVVKSLFLAPYHGALTASLRSADYLQFHGFKGDRIAMGYDTLSVERLARLSGLPPAPKGTPFAERDFVIVARLVPKKNIAMALDAYAAWRRHAQSQRDLHLCGSGPLEAELRAQAEALGIAGHVHFHGFVQSEQVGRILGRALCLILPSVEEQYGLVIAEALAVGLPVLVSRNAGACDMLVDPGVNGFTIDPHNPEALAALMALLSEDEALWTRFALAAHDNRMRGDVRHFAAGVQQLARLA